LKNKILREGLNPSQLKKIKRRLKKMYKCRENDEYYSKNARVARTNQRNPQYDEDIKWILIETKLTKEEFLRRNSLYVNDIKFIKQNDGYIATYPLYENEIQSLRYEKKVNIFDGDKFLSHREIE
jgi:hypothetical protein